jgi:hypothetical protein
LIFSNANTPEVSKIKDDDLNLKACFDKNRKVDRSPRRLHMRKLLLALALGAAFIVPTMAQKSPAARAYEFSQKLSDQCHQVFFAGMYVSCYITCRNTHTNESEDELNQYCMNSCYLSRDKAIATRIKTNKPIVPEEICPPNSTTNATADKEHSYSSEPWPGEKPSATAESAKNRPLIPEEKIQQQEPNKTGVASADQKEKFKEKVMDGYSKCVHETMKHPETWNTDAFKTQIPECQQFLEMFRQNLPYPYGDAVPQRRRYPDNPPNVTGSKGRTLGSDPGAILGGNPDSVRK